MESSNDSDLFILQTTFNCYFLVLCSLNNAGRKFSSAIRFMIDMGESSLKIKLGPSSPINIEKNTSQSSQDQKKLKTTEFIEKLQKDGIQTVQIVSSRFSYKSRKEFNVLMSLLQLISITKLQFTIKDCEPDFLEELNLLLSAALCSSQDLTRLALNYSYCKFSVEAQESFKIILQKTFSMAEKLEKFEFKAFDESLLFAKIIEGIMNAGKGLPKSLKELVLECGDFSDKAIIVRIFKYLENIVIVKIKANKVDIDDETVLKLAENVRMSENLESLHLPLRNQKVGDYSVQKLLKVKFIKMKYLMIDFEDSSVTKEAFDLLIQDRFKNFKQVEKFPFDLENTRIDEKDVNLLMSLYETQKNGYKGDEESSEKAVYDI